MEITTRYLAEMRLSKYCMHCGEKLIISAEPTNIFDLKTGRKLVWFMARCPKKGEGFASKFNRHTSERDDNLSCEP